MSSDMIRSSSSSAPPPPPRSLFSIAGVSRGSPVDWFLTSCATSSKVRSIPCWIMIVNLSSDAKTRPEFGPACSRIGQSPSIDNFGQFLHAYMQSNTQSSISCLCVYRDTFMNGWTVHKCLDRPVRSRREPQGVRGSWRPALDVEGLGFRGSLRPALDGCPRAHHQEYSSNFPS